MSLAIHSIPANPEDKCHCCGRVHRKLYNVDGYWLGQSCADDYKLYKIDSNINCLYWRGWEKKHAKVARMVRGGFMPSPLLILQR